LMVLIVAFGAEVGWLMAEVDAAPTEIHAVSFGTRKRAPMLKDNFRRTVGQALGRLAAFAAAWASAGMIRRRKLASVPAAPALAFASASLSVPRTLRARRLEIGPPPHLPRRCGFSRRSLRTPAVN
jgi:hypothetical protein